MPESVFEVRELKFGYDKKTEVLHGINLSLPKGEVTAIIGPNGCGKTTLFGILSKTFKPWSGEVKFCGKLLSEIARKEYATMVSAVHQYNTVPDDMTVRNLVLLGRTPYHNTIFSGRNSKDVEITEEVMAITGVDVFAERRVKELSGGQMQRVWLALAMAQSKDTLLLDEITTYLDIRYQYEILNLIRDMNARFNTTVIMVLHDLNQAIEFADNAVVMKDGKVICTGRAEEVITAQTIKNTYGIDADIASIGNRRICVFNKNKIIFNKEQL